MTYRFTPHMQLKLQYTLQDQPSVVENLNHTFAAQVHGAVLIRRA